MRCLVCVCVDPLHEIVGGVFSVDPLYKVVGAVFSVCVCGSTP